MPGTSRHTMVRPGRLSLITLIALSVVALHAWASRQGHGYQTLTSAEMSRICGSSTCMGCSYTGVRTDECYHAFDFDSCSPNKCIADYSIESSCTPGTGTCTAVMNYDSVGLVQYLRVDSNCTQTNDKYVIWLLHYFGEDCQVRHIQIRCQKTNGACNGTLIESDTVIPGIVCN